jgi:hypothetical protein
VKIGVALALDRDAGELYADARALENAGADSFWTASTDGQAMLLAAIAAVTSRARIVVVDIEPGRTTDGLALLSRGRLAMAATRGRELILAAGEQGDERWIRVPFPDGRAAWNEVRGKAEAEGIGGIILPNDPRLLDLVRNPDVTDDRSDLKLAFG